MTYFVTVSFQEETPPKANCQKKALKCVVTVLFIVIVVGIVVIWMFHEGRSRKHLGNAMFDFVARERVFNVYDAKDEIAFSGNIRVSDCDDNKIKQCYDEKTHSNYCFIFGDGAIFSFHLYDLGKDKDVHCADIIWENLQTESYTYTDCFNIDYGSWYGFPNFVVPFWPLKVTNSIEEISYRPYSEEKLGHILEGLWINTQGIAVAAYQNVPIQVSVRESLVSSSDRKLCISLDQKAQKIPSHSFNYSVCSGPDIKQTFIEVRNAYFPKSPVLDFAKHDFANILWQYENKGQAPSGFGSFLNELRTDSLPIHLVQYDSTWQYNTGDFKFSEQTRNVFTQYLSGKYSDTKLFLPMSLACAYMSDNFREGAQKKLFASDFQTGSMKTVLYRDQSCALWDTSNPETRAFLKQSLNSLQQKGTLEQTTYPQGFNFLSLVNSQAFPLSLFENTSDVNAINIDFAQFLLSINKTVLMQSALHMQNLSIFVEIPTKVANADGKKCLDYVIPAALTAGIHGYPYVMTAAPSEDQVDHELFSRWLQIAFFFPGLKITNALTTFKKQGETTLLAKNMSTYRENVIVPLLHEATKDVAKGYPIIRPLWWLQPTDFKTYQIADQFLVGDTLMVAPILCHGDRKRDIYLPVGKWVHTFTGQIFSGKQLLRDFEVPLYEVAVFEFIDDPMDSE